MLGYKAGLSKIGLLPKKLPFEDLFRLDSVNRVLMFKTMGVSAAQLKRWIDDTTNGWRAIC